jgi:hypothetical protein
MRNYFRITGYAVNKRGLTVGIGYQLISSDTKQQRPTQCFRRSVKVSAMFALPAFRRWQHEPV